MRVPELAPSVTVPAAVVAVVVGVLFVQLTDGHRIRTVIDRVDAGTPALAETGATRVSVTAAAPVRPACHDIVQLGDSNLGIAASRFRAAYGAAGVEAIVDAAVGRGASVSKEGSTGLDAIAAYRKSVPPPRRCWVIDFGAADAVDANRHGRDPSASIAVVIDALHGEPALWITPVLASATTDWTLAASTAYDLALLRLSAEHDNITVVDWQDVALQHLDEFQPDGVHYDSALYDLLVTTVMNRVGSAWDLQP